MKIPTLLIAAGGLATRDLDYGLLDPKRDFCVHGFHQSAVLDNILYIVGGFAVYNYNNTRYAEPNTYLRTLNLTAPFTLNSPSSAPFTFTPNPPAVPEISSGSLWPYNSTLFLAGGVTEPVNTKFPNWTDTSNTNAVWTYQPSTSAWTSLLNLVRDASGARIPTIAGSNTAYVERGGGGGDGATTGYLLGGNQNPWLSIGYRGLLVYDFAARTWTNESTPFAQWSSGALVHVPVGRNGILVSLGGTQNNDPFTFDQVEVFNLNTNAWSSRQPAKAAAGGGGGTGVPGPRTAFCAVLMAAPDQSSFQIFVYGGTLAGEYTGERPQLGDVWVLSIPSFEWFNVYDGADAAGAAGKREAHSCHAVAGRQMLVYGGRTKPQENQTCDRTGVFAFDMVDLAWQTEFKPNAGAYQVPALVAKHLANSSRFPAENLTDPNIQYMFETHAPEHPQLTSSTTESGNPPRTNTRQPAGPIAGGVVAALAIAACVLFLVLRRRAALQKLSESPSPKSSIEIPDTQFPVYYTTEMPHHTPPAWELSASPRNSVRV